MFVHSRWTDESLGLIKVQVTSNVWNLLFFSFSSLRFSEFPTILRVFQTLQTNRTRFQTRLLMAAKASLPSVEERYLWLSFCCFSWLSFLLAFSLFFIFFAAVFTFLRYPPFSFGLSVLLACFFLVSDFSIHFARLLYLFLPFLSCSFAHSLSFLHFLLFLLSFLLYPPPLSFGLSLFLLFLSILLVCFIFFCLFFLSFIFFTVFACFIPLPFLLVFLSCSFFFICFCSFYPFCSLALSFSDFFFLCCLSSLLACFPSFFLLLLLSFYLSCSLAWSFFLSSFLSPALSVCESLISR